MRADPLGTPRIASAVVEELLEGGRNLRTAFLKTPIREAAKDAALLSPGEGEAVAILIRQGFAYRSTELRDHQYTITDILVPGDVAGLDGLAWMRPVDQITAAGAVSYHTLDATALRRLFVNPAVASRILALAAEARWRAAYLAAAIGHLDAQARLAFLLLNIHDRLLRRGMITGPRYALPLTQMQIGDYLGLTPVHLNRTLRRLREERIALLRRQAVVILDIDRLRGLAQCPQPPIELPELDADAATLIAPDRQPSKSRRRHRPILSTKPVRPSDGPERHWNTPVLDRSIVNQHFAEEIVRQIGAGAYDYLRDKADLAKHVGDKESAVSWWDIALAAVEILNEHTADG